MTNAIFRINVASVEAMRIALEGVEDKKIYESLSGDGRNLVAWNSAEEFLSKTIAGCGAEFDVTIINGKVVVYIYD